MGKLRRRYGFWGTVGSYRLRDFWAPEFLFGPLIGGAIGLALVRHACELNRINLAGDYLALSGALLGVVFGGFALVIAFLSDSHLRDLEKTSEGVVSFLRPFMFSTGLQAGVLLGVIAYRAAGQLVPPWIEGTGFVVISILFVIALLDIVALARTVMLHGVARGRASAKAEPGNDS